MDFQTATVKKTRDVRPHANFWHTSKCLLDRGLEQEEGSYHQFMSSLVFTAFALEAYLNWLGNKLVPHWRYLERLSPKDKLALLSDQIGVSLDFGKRPWETINRLFTFRNDIAHGKPEILESETTQIADEYLDKKLGESQRTSWELFCTCENAQRAREDISNILKSLHHAAGFTKDDDLGPFSSGFQIHEARLIPESPQETPGSGPVKN